MLKAIVLASHNPGLALIRGLGQKRVPVTVLYYDKNDMGYVSRYVKDRYHVPNPDFEEEAFIHFICNNLKDHEGAVVFPSDDATLGAISRNKKYLEDKGFKVACTEWEITVQYLNKIHSYQLAEQVGVPIPRTAIVKSIHDIENFTSDIELPCLVKPCVSHLYYELFKRKMVKVENVDQLHEECLLALDKGLEVMIQEFIPGDDTQGVNYNSLIWNGDVIHDHMASKIRLSPKFFGVPSVVVNRVIPELRIPALKILNALGFYGYSCTEFKKDPRDGIYKFMEVNGRINRSGLHPIACGINFPWLIYAYLTNTPSEKWQLSRRRIYWIDATRDLATTPPRILKESYSIKDFILPYFRSNVFAAFDLKDPFPFFKRSLDLFKRILISFNPFRR